jgi:putative transposase
MILKSAAQCQRLISIHGPISNLFDLHRNRTSAVEHRDLRTVAMTARRYVTMSIAV